MESDKRQHARVTSRLRCWCEGREVTLYARVGNLSEGGLFVKTQTPLQAGARTRLKLEEGEVEVDAEAVVIWARDEGQGGPAGMGLAFMSLEDTAQLRLRQLIALERSRGGVTPDATDAPRSV